MQEEGGDRSGRPEPRLLLIHGGRPELEASREALAESGWTVDLARGPLEAAPLLQRERYGLLVCELVGGAHDARGYRSLVEAAGAREGRPPAIFAVGPPSPAPPSALALQALGVDWYVDEGRLPDELAGPAADLLRYGRPSRRPGIWIVDDEADSRPWSGDLAQFGYALSHSRDPAGLRAALEAESPDLVVVRGDGLHPSDTAGLPTRAPTVVIARQPSAEQAARWLGAGALDYLDESAEPERLGLRLHAMAARAARERAEAMRSRARRRRAGIAEPGHASGSELVQLAEGVGDVLWLWDPSSFEPIYVSPSFERVWGRTVQSLHDDPGSFFETIHPEDRPRLRETLGAPARGEGQRIEYRIVRPEGDVRWIRGRSFPIRDAEGRTIRVAGISADITSERRVADSLRRLAAAGTGAIGHEYVRLLVPRLGEAFGVSWAELAVVEGAEAPRLEPLALWNGRKLVEGTARPAAGTPGGVTLERARLHLTHGAWKLFPEDSFLQEKQIESYLGISIVGSGGETLGLIALMDPRPMAIPAEADSILEVFAGRSALELERERAERALQTSESRLHRLAEALPQIFLLSNAKMTEIHYVSPAYERIFGRSCESLRRDPGAFAQYVHPDDLDRFRASIQRHREGIPSEVEFRARREDGSLIWMRHSTFPIFSAEGGVAQVAALSEDITEGKQLEETLHKLGEAVSATTGEEFFESLVTHLARALGMPYAMVCEFARQPEEPAGTVAVFARDGIVPNFEYPMAGTPGEQARLGRARVVAEGAARRFPDDAWLREHGIETCVTLPLGSGEGEPIGFLAVASPERLEEPGPIETLLRLFAARASAELIRRRTDLELRAHIELEELISRISTHFLNLAPSEVPRGIEKSLRALGQLTGSDRCTASSMSADYGTLSVLTQWCREGIEPNFAPGDRVDLGEYPWLAARIRDAEVVLVRSPEDLPPEARAERSHVERKDCRSVLWVPLVGRDGPVGLLSLTSTHVVRDWGDEVATGLLRTVGEILGSALVRQREDALLRERESRLRRQGRMLLELSVGKSVGSGELERELDELVETAARGLEVERVNLWMFCPDRSRLVCRASYLLGAGHRGSQPELETMRCPAYVRSLEEGRVVDAVDARTDPRTREFLHTYLIPLDIRSLLDAPIRRRGQVIGVVCHESVGRTRDWTDDEKHFAASVADLAALALEAADRQCAQEETQARNRELSALHRISQITLRTSSMNDALDEVVEEVSALTGFPICHVTTFGHQDEVVRFRAWRGLPLPRQERPVEMPIAQTTCAPILTSGRPRIAVGHAEPDSLHPLLRQLADGTTAGVPLIDGERVIGSLCVARPEAQAPDDRLIPLLESLAGAITSLIRRREAEHQEAQLRARLLQSQKLEAIGTLAGGVAHDFNNLMTAVLGNAWLLKEDCPPDSSVYQAADAIENAAERASELTQKLLGFARRGRKESVPVDLESSVSEVIGLLRRTLERTIDIEQDFAAERSVIRGDPSQLHQIILNLAVNARDAMPSGGRLRFATRSLELDQGACELRPGLKPGPHVEISVSDTGEGIPRENLERIFEPFFTTKEPGKGTGMGLSMVYGMVKAHGGLIGVESRPARGATFRMLFPLVDEEELPSLGTGASDVPVRGRGRVLVVDDEHIVRSTASELLRSLGYEVICAEDGVEALEVFRERADEIDLVLLDVIMPRMGGRECLRALKRLAPELPVVLASGWSMEGTAQEALDEGALAFLTKPFQLARLSQVLAGALEPQGS